MGGKETRSSFYERVMLCCRTKELNAHMESVIGNGESSYETVDSIHKHVRQGNVKYIVEAKRKKEKKMCSQEKVAIYHN